MHRVACRSPLGFALFLACVLAFASHVCALPAAAGAHDVAPFADATDDHQGDAIHVASCEVVTAQPAHAPALVVASEPIVAAPVPATHSVRVVRPAPAIHRPPRFLLHAALLI